jgi:hypothetical protein
VEERSWTGFLIVLLTEVRFLRLPAFLEVSETPMGPVGRPLSLNPLCFQISAQPFSGRSLTSSHFGDDPVRSGALWATLIQCQDFSKEERRENGVCQHGFVAAGNKLWDFTGASRYRINPTRPRDPSPWAGRWLVQGSKQEGSEWSLFRWLKYRSLLE